ncbi:hypothetical protein NU219Hw_g290t1 [Hortaea werneckii]
MADERKSKSNVNDQQRSLINDSTSPISNEEDHFTPSTNMPRRSEMSQRLTIGGNTTPAVGTKDTQPIPQKKFQPWDPTKPPSADFLVRWNDPSTWLSTPAPAGLSTAQDAAMTDATPDEESPSAEALLRLNKQAETLLSIIGNWQRSEISKLGDDTKMQKLKDDLLNKKSRTFKGMVAIIQELDTFFRGIFDEQQQIFQESVNAYDKLKDIKLLPAMQAGYDRMLAHQKQIGEVLSKLLTTKQDVSRMEATPTSTAGNSLQQKSDDQISPMEDTSRSKSHATQLDNVTEGVKDIRIQPS